MKRLIFLSFFASLTVAHAEPLVTSWLTNISSKYARIYTSTANRTAGTSATTWSGTQSQTTPAYAGVNEINSSTNWVYVRSTGLGGHVMGPWSNPNLPKNQSILWRFPRTPTIPTTKTLTGMGSIGFMVDGVAAYNTSDGFSYSNANAVDGTPNGSVGAGDGIWNRDALPNESVSFDNALAHNQPSGEYHYHANAISTRYLAGDNIVYDSSAKTYAENTSTTNFQHSPIIGWMKDGLPLYGPYGYDGGSTGATATATLSGSTVGAVSVTAGGTLYQSVPLVTFSGGGGSGAAATAVVTAGVITSVTVTNGGSGYTSAPTVKIGGVRRMISGYQLRDGTNNTTNLVSTGRTTLPAWALAAQNRAQLSSSTQYGPATTYTTTGLTYTLGHYAEDYDYLGDLGFTQSSRTNAGSVFFDLNKYNVRFCVTPEYPNGTWAYFATIKADGTSFYPYIVGRWYYGDPSIGGGSTTATVMNADTPLTQQFIGGANSAITVNTPTVSSGSVSLTWSSVEGGTYSVDASTNQSTWTSEKTALTPTNVPTAPTVGNSTVTTNTSYTTLGSSGTEYARVNRTALATYDSAGQTASTVAQSTITPYSASGIPNTVPTITAISTQSTNQNTTTSAIPFTVGDAETVVASLTLSGSSSNTTLVPNTNIVFGGSGASRTVTVAPATNQTGSATITVGVNDGIATTTTTFTLTVTASTPVITNVIQTPSAPTSADVVAVKANVAAPSGRTLSTVQLTYDTGAGGSSTVFNETMAAAATTAWDGTGSNYAWTMAFSGPPTTPFSQTSTANHTASGAGNQYGMEINRSSPQIAQSTMTTTNAIDATGTSAYVEFYLATANLSGTMGWDLQTSPDGTTWTTVAGRSELTGINQAYTLKHFDLASNERVSTLKLRFRFVGSGTGTPASKISLDDIKVVTTTAAAPVTVTMFDDGAHGDGSASDGVYGASIPAQVNNTTVTYSIAATDSSTASASTTNSSYTVGVAPATMTVTPSSGLTSSGTAGGPFTPSTANYTITNTGSTSMNWTASKTASWLSLDSTSGTLAASATATVNATINSTANSLSAGSFNDTITFANTTNGNGNTTRAVALSVSAPSLPAAPVLSALPTYSSGTAKAISWTAVSGATSYTLQVASSSNFSTNLLSSQTVTSPTGSFSALIAGTTYYYRVLATNSVGSSTYSNIVSSTQDAVGPTVAITSPASAQSTATNTITVSGTSSDTQSGIAKVTVNGVTATTSNSFATWSISVPLGFGTNGITAVAYDGAGNTTTTAPVNVTLTTAQTYNPLIIPEVMTGTTFNLNLHKTTKQFLTGAVTNTYAYNNMLFWGPTLIMNKGDWVQMNVANNLDDTTTTHWHGFHIPAIMDGGPHQTIPAGTTWSPSFKVDNKAGLYWYHPHLHQFTQQQLSYGAGGMIIIKDDEEAALNLPRTYGVDDVPLALTSRRFTSNQFVTTNSAYGDQMVVNGTLSPQVSLPKQYVRLRILNAEMERSYNLGFSDGRTFYIIGTDGGLVNAPIAVTKVVLGVGERIEVLVNLSNDTVGSSFNLMSYNSTASRTGYLATDYPGGEAGTSGQFGSSLNNTDFNILHINVAAATASPVTVLPTTLASNTYWTTGNVTNNRALTITGGIAGATDWAFDNTAFSANVINQTINLNAVEKWTITNNSGFSHTLHIHDIQFNVIARTGGSGVVGNHEQGWKDTLYVQRNTSVQVIAKFDTFASNSNPFMYHCHFSPHEDEGLMGQFLVVNNAVEDLAIASFTRTGASDNIVLNFKATPGTTYTLQYSPDMTTSSWTDIGSVTSDGTSANFTETNTTRLGQARGFYRVKIPVIP